MSRGSMRRDFLRLMGLGGVVFASGLAGCAPRKDFFFLQLSDTHWGYQGPANPEADVTLKRTVAAINAAARQPDFIVFTGDLTHTTDDPGLRRARMAEFKQIVSGLRVKDLRFLPGEHDASIDHGEAYREHFGEAPYVFDHEGVHFVALDNVSDPTGALGDAQLAWLEKDLARLPRGAPIVVLAHRPLFDLYPAWEWSTPDGAKAVAILSQHENVTVFYGHIHQEHQHTTGRIAHHAARSLVFPLPAPGAAPKRAPLPWDAASPTHGIGYRGVEPDGALGYRLSEMEG
jgi:Calcineurin-like phosphoesterase